MWTSMTLRKKTLLTLIAIIIMLMLVVYAVMSFILLDSLTLLEETHTQQDVERFVDAIYDELEEISITVGDWAVWDDTYRFIQDSNDTYKKHNLNSTTLEQLQINFMVFLNTDEKIVFSQTLDLVSGEPSPVLVEDLVNYLAVNDTLLDFDGYQGKSGFILLDNEPVLITAHPIVTSHREGPARGTLIIGRVLNQVRINYLNEQTYLHATVLTEPAIETLTDTQHALTLLSDDMPIVTQSLSDYAIVGYTMLPDLQHNPLLMVRVANQRDFYLQGKVTLYSLLLALTIMGIIFCVVIVLFFDKLVLVRLARLSANVATIGTTGDLAVRVHTQGQDELAGLAEDINHMLDDLEHTQEKQRESEARYRAVVEQAAEGIFLLDPKTMHITDSNRAFQELLGYTAAELATQTVYDIVAHPPTNIANLLNQVITQNQRFSGERTYRQKDGTPIEVEVSSMLITESDDPVVCAVVRDVTQRKRYERELKAIVTVTSSLRDVSSRQHIIETIVEQTSSLVQAAEVALLMMVPSSNGVILEKARGKWASMSGLRFQQSQLFTEQQAYCPLIFIPPAIGGAPLIANGHTIGMICISRQSKLDNTELRILTAIADIAAAAIHRASLYEQIEHHLHELTALHAIDMAISTTLDLSSMLKVFLDQALTHLPVDGVVILLYNRHLQTLSYAAGRGEDGYAMQGITYRLGEGQAGRAVLERRIVSLQRNEDGTWQTEPDYALFSRLSKPFPKTYAVPLIARGEVKGVLQFFHRSPLDPDPEWSQFLEALAAHTAIAIDNIQLLQDIQRSRDALNIAYDATLEGWARALDLRDHETEGHSQRVTTMTIQLAQEMGISGAELVHIRRGALLHDIGKIGIPDAILHKPGPLDDEELAIMRKHPEYAYTMIAPIAYLRPSLDIPYCHHERWDGTGYPRGLKGEEIPLAARIFAIVDVWDALSSDRPYRKAWTPEQVTAHIQKQSGSHFDPQVVEAFLRMQTNKKTLPTQLGEHYHLQRYEPSSQDIECEVYL